jgi:hypothetical protein
MKRRIAHTLLTALIAAGLLLTALGPTSPPEPHSFSLFR